MLVDMIPGSLVRLFARPYVAGDSIEDGIGVALDLLQKGTGTTLDLLAEDVETEAQTQDNLRIYLQMIEQIGAESRFAPGKEGLDRLHPTVSLKPSSYTTRPLDRGEDMDARGSKEAMGEIVRAATKAGIPSTIDMESRHWTDFTLEATQELFREGLDVGTVLQTRLNRTKGDLANIPEGMRIRLVIGIYREPESVATTSKPEMKKRMLDDAEQLLNQGNYVEFATHDEQVVRRFLTEVVPRVKAKPDQFEIQMLYGVPREALIRDIQSGRLSPGGGVPPVRLYVPFAVSWDQATAYLRRRLMENPGVGFYVARNLLSSLFGKKA